VLNSYGRFSAIWIAQRERNEDNENRSRLYNNQEGIELPTVDLREKPKKRSWGVSFVDVHKSERNECTASARTSCQYFTGRFFDLRQVTIAFQIMPLYRST
jgi:hypothetical protein